MEIWQIVVIVFAVLIGLGLVGLAGLFVLAGLARNPHRSPVRRRVSEAEMDEYFARNAGFGIELVVNTPLSRKEIWERLADAPYLSSLPFLKGPVWDQPVDHDGPRTRHFSGTFLSVAEEVVSIEDQRSITLTGTAVSLPLSIRDFAESFEIKDGPRDTRDVVWRIGGSPRWVAFLPWRWFTPFARPVLAFVLRHILRLQAFRRPRSKSD